MDFFVWTPAISVGVEIIDTQHKKLIDTINRLYQANNDGKKVEELDRIFNELFDYIAHHFATEEKYFNLFHYPETAAHKREHQHFAMQIRQYRRKWRDQQPIVPHDLFLFLKEWLVDHVCRQDKAYQKCFKEHGLK